MSFPVIFIFIAFAMCNMCKSEDEFKAVIEGDDVQLNFLYPCNSTRVTLQYGIRVPFYTLADTESISLPPVQVQRFTFNNKSEHDHCSLHVRINPVMRIDAGTYIFFAYSEDGIYESSFKRIGLDVEFLPGKASCTMGEENTVGNWVALNCMAPVGSLLGQIDCYQNGEKMPLITSPTETHQHLKQSIHVNKKHPVFCCTSTWEHTIDLCDCNDFQWDLANDLNLTSVIDPCDPTTSAQDQTQTSEATFTPSQPVSTTASTIKINLQNCSVRLKYAYNITIAGLVILVIVLILRTTKSKEIFLSCSRKLKSSKVQSLPMYEPIPSERVHKPISQRSISI